MAVNTVQLEQKRIQIRGIPVHYQVAGEGEPLVLVHGLSGSSQWWAKNVGPLAEHFRVYIVDLVGFGASKGDHPFILDEASRFLVEWMDEVGIERVNLIGHSMGGFISADLAADHPQRVERLVLVDAAGLPFDPNVLKHAYGLTRAVRYMPPDFLPVLVRDVWRAGPKTMVSAMRQILSSNLQDKLSQVEVPTLVVWGEFDTVISVEVGQELSKALSIGEFVVLKGAGHNPMWDRAEAFNDLVLNFLTAEPQEQTDEKEQNREQMQAA
jgi:pimeloyl-ACP methyl ester carboxylesterase